MIHLVPENNKMYFYNKLIGLILWKTTKINWLILEKKIKLKNLNH